MRKLLVVDCCIRKEESRTKKILERFLSAAPSDCEVERLVLTEENLAPLVGDFFEQRQRLLETGDFSHPRFRYAKQFANADLVVIAAPFWDLSFPSLLKVYLEQVSVAGLTFGYTQEGQCVGHCRARRLLYFSTCGGYVGEEHLGFAYVKALGAMLGIPECVPYILEGLDIDPAQRETVLAEGILRLRSQLAEDGRA